jgi:hypothetical protein
VQLVRSDCHAPRQVAILATTLLIFGQSATAARLDVLPSATSVRPGDALSITVTGDSEGAFEVFFRVVLEYEGVIEPSNATGPFLLNSGTSNEWTTFSQHGRCDLVPVGSCVAADAGSLTNPLGGPALELLPSTLSVFAFDTSAALPGSTLTFQAMPAPNFFVEGVTSEVVSVHVIPEPATAALLGLGLAAMAVVRRKREA